MNESSLTSDSDTYTSSQCTTPDSANSLFNSLPPTRNPLAKKALHLLSKPRRSPVQEEKHRRHSSAQHSLPNGNHHYHHDLSTRGPDHFRRRAGSSLLPKKPCVHSHIANAHLHGEFSVSQPAINFIGERDVDENGFSIEQFTDRTNDHFQSGNIAVAYPKLIKHSLEDLLHVPGPVAVSVPIVHKVKSQHTNCIKSPNSIKPMPSSTFIDSSNRRSSVEQTNIRPIMKPIPVAIPKVPHYKKVNFNNSASASHIHGGAQSQCYTLHDHQGTTAHNYVDFDIAPGTVNTLPRCIKSTSLSVPNGVYRPRTHSHNESSLPTRSSLVSANKHSLPIRTVPENDITSSSSSHTSPFSPLELNRQRTLGSTMQGVRESTKTNQVRRDHSSVYDTQTTKLLYQSSLQSGSVSKSNTLKNHSDSSTQTDDVMCHPHVPFSRVKPLSMFTYTSLNHTHFPKRVRISKGELYLSTGMAISVGHELNLHFIKRTKVVVIQDKKRNNYYLPLYTSLRISIVYNPSGSEKSKVKEVKFKCAGDVMCQKHIPLVIAATKSYNGGCEEKSVQSGEVLIVKGIKNDQHDGRCLKVQSANGTKKFLRENCTGHFTTKPSLTRLTMKEVFDSSIVLPQKVILHASSSFQQATILPSEVTFSQYTSCTSVIATDAFLLVENVPSRVLELPLNLELELQETIGMSAAINGRLQETAKEVHQSFDPSITMYCFDVPKTVNHELQCALYHDLGKVTPWFGVDLVRPSWNDPSQTRPSSTACTNHNPLNTGQVSITKVSPKTTHREAGRGKQDVLNDEVTCNDYDGEMMTVGKLAEQVRTLEQQCTSTSQQLSYFSQQYEEVVSALNKIQNKLSSPPMAKDSDVTQTLHLLGQLSSEPAHGNITKHNPVSATLTTNSQPAQNRDHCIEYPLDIPNATSTAGDLVNANVQNSSTTNSIPSVRNMKHLLPNPSAHTSPNTKEHFVSSLSTIRESQSHSPSSASSSPQFESHETTPGLSSDDVDMADYLPKNGHLAKHTGRTVEAFDKLLQKKELQATHAIGDSQLNGYMSKSVSLPTLPHQTAGNEKRGRSSRSPAESYSRQLPSMTYYDGSQSDDRLVLENKQNHSHAQILENSHNRPTDSNVELRPLYPTYAQPVSQSSMSDRSTSAHLSPTETSWQSRDKSPAKSPSSLYSEDERCNNPKQDKKANSIHSERVLQTITTSPVSTLEPIMSKSAIDNTRATEPHEAWIQEESGDLDHLVDDIAAWCSQLEAEVSLMSQ